MDRMAGSDAMCRSNNKRHLSWNLFCKLSFLSLVVFTFLAIMCIKNSDRVWRPCAADLFHLKSLILGFAQTWTVRKRAIIYLRAEFSTRLAPITSFPPQMTHDQTTYTWEYRDDVRNSKIHRRFASRWKTQIISLFSFLHPSVVAVNWKSDATIRLYSLHNSKVVHLCTGQC